MRECDGEEVEGGREGGVRSVRCFKEGGGDWGVVCVCWKRVVLGTGSPFMWCGDGLYGCGCNGKGSQMVMNMGLCEEQRGGDVVYVLGIS